MAKKSNVAVFKEYTMGQIVLLPRDLEDEIEANHLVRVVDAAVEKMDLSKASCCETALQGCRDGFRAHQARLGLSQVPLARVR